MPAPGIAHELGSGVALPGVGTRVGGFRLVRELGIGGFGSVYLGEDTSGRRAAVKLLHPHLSTDTRVRRYFARELAMARRVQGFCLAEILDADPGAEQPWLATEYVEGPTLGRAVREYGPRAGGDLQRLAVQTITALAAIHAAGVVHRDLKPANILLGQDGPRVIDFGIARALDADTHSATRIGTLGYMAPEQIEGTTLGPSADVFAWGAVIIHAATGAEAFPGPTQAARINRVLTQPPEPGDLTDPLLSIALACTHKDPDQRPTARQIWDMLLTGRTTPPETRRAGRPDPRRTLRTVAKLRHGHRVDAIAFSTDGATLATGGADGTVRLWDATTGKQHTAILTAGVASVTAIAFNPTGTTIAVKGTDPDFGTVLLWDPAAADEPASLVAHEDGVGPVAFSPDGAVLATLVSFVRTCVMLWDPVTGERAATLSGPAAASLAPALAFSPDSTTLATASSDGSVGLWDPATGELRSTITGTGAWVFALAFSPGGSTLATADRDGIIGLCDLATGRATVTRGATHDWDYSVVFSPDATTFATGHTDGTVAVRDSATGRPQATITGGDHAFPEVFSPDGNLLVTSRGTSGNARLWDLVTGEERVLLTGGEQSVRSVAFSPDSTTLATGSEDGTVLLHLIA